MARLLKHGTELLRIAREIETPDGELTIWERRTLTYMSNGKVLQKLDCRFKPDQFDPAGRFYSYGWKMYGKIKKDHTPTQAVGIITTAIKEGRSKWTVVSGEPAPVILSASRILRAIESGDSVGFCKACGEEAYGIEPDARGYTCESCGQPEVYGAEECLIAL